jgi:hypothetical protein
LGALESLYQTHYEQEGDRMSLRPFPQHAPKGYTVPEFWTKYRTEMIEKSGSCVFIAGNRSDEKGVIREAKGVIEEFDIAVSLKKYPIPVGATGHASSKLWTRVRDDLSTYFPGGGVKTHFDVLGNANKSNDQLIESIFAILKQVNSK